MSFVFYPFSTKDLPAYRAWFKDRATARFVSYPTDEWLDYVLTQDVICNVVLDIGPKRIKDHENLVIGVVQMDLDPERECGHCDLVIAPFARNRSIGARVMDAFIKGPAAHIRTLRAAIAPENMPSLACARNAGFKVETPFDADGLVRVVRHNTQSATA